ncbi:hypothetical protein BAJUN_00800 [Bajunvirus bajun]|uniref:Uncharacterized protein n=1 Tax=Brevundimonas phage vB_BgoS-Bajun TaxID=2948594 RepID=A0A9E7N664_9CAUD|nr:hypothetical protein BAJUN_00800 [Brevundimonas phage vB_BgoS-Bajun]
MAAEIPYRVTCDDPQCDTDIKIKAPDGSAVGSYDLPLKRLLNAMGWDTDHAGMTICPNHPRPYRPPEFPVEAP